jgi:outer membrane receptor protein involved in Fe transport
MKSLKKHFVFFLILTYLFTNNVSSQTPDTSSKDVFSMDLEELMNIKITTAGKKAERISEIPASVVLLSREEIKTYGYSTLNDILSNIPGMFLINDYYFPNGTFGVRGFWPGSDDRNIMIMINGVNQLYDLTSAYNMNNITVPVEAIDRIEIVRGPMAVIYGNGSFYGVINIITNESNNSQISASTGSLNTRQLFGRTAGSQGDLKYSANASVYNTKGIGYSINKLVRETSIATDKNDKQYYGRASSEILDECGIPMDYSTNGRLENNQKYINLSCSYKPLTIDFSYNESVGEGYYVYPSPYEGSPTLMSNTSIMGNYRKDLSKRITIEGKLNYSAYRNLSKYDYLYKEFYGIQQHECNTIESEVNVFYRITNYLNLTSGLYERSILNAYNMFDIPAFRRSHQYYELDKNDHITTQAWYNQVDFQPFKKLKITAGLRMEQMPQHTLNKLQADSTMTIFTTISYKYNQEKIAVIPRLAVIWSLNERNIFKLLYGQAINRPSFFQNTTNNFDPQYSNLQPEKITTYEVNYISYISDKLMINTSLYYNTLDKLIIRTSQFDIDHNYSTWFSNSGKLETYGAELSIQANITKALKFEISETYQKTKDLRANFKNIKVAYSPEFLGYAKISYLFNQNFRIGLTGNYVGEMLPYYDETVRMPDSTYGARIGDKVKGYLSIGLNTRVDNLTKYNFYANVKLDNLLNQEIRYPTTVNNTWADKGTIGPGFTFMVSLGKKF